MDRFTRRRSRDVTFDAASHAITPTLSRKMPCNVRREENSPRICIIQGAGKEGSDEGSVVAAVLFTRVPRTSCGHT